MDTGPTVAASALVVAGILAVIGAERDVPALMALAAGLACAAVTWLVTRSAIVSALRKVRDEG